MPGVAAADRHEEEGAALQGAAARSAGAGGRGRPRGVQEEQLSVELIWRCISSARVVAGELTLHIVGMVSWKIGYTRGLIYFDLPPSCKVWMATIVCMHLLRWSFQAS